MEMVECLWSGIGSLGKGKAIIKGNEREAKESGQIGHFGRKKLRWRPSKREAISSDAKPV